DRGRPLSCAHSLLREPSRKVRTGTAVGSVERRVGVAEIVEPHMGSPERLRNSRLEDKVSGLSGDPFPRSPPGPQPLDGLTRLLLPGWRLPSRAGESSEPATRVLIACNPISV